jgi:nucleotide-binding universal stress UspA family protein
VIGTVLVAVDDSSAALRAATVAVELAARLGCRLRFVTVLQDGVLAAAMESVSPEPAVAERRERTAAAVLAHVGRLAREGGVDAETCERWGAPLPQILAEASASRADLLVLGRAGGRAPYADGVGLSVVELAEVPVLVVP